jgi:hypothetical protein
MNEAVSVVSPPEKTKAAGRIRMFETLPKTIGILMSEVGDRSIALPDLQRPFVWSDSQVCDLLDSVYRGFPAGVLVFWRASLPSEDFRPLGVQPEAAVPVLRVPHYLVVDGQQRLTALRAALYGETVLNERYQERRIAVSFDPLQGRFFPAAPDGGDDPLVLGDVSRLWKEQDYEVIRDFCDRVETLRGKAVRRECEAALWRLARDVDSYAFPAIFIGAEATEEMVGEIFVRINREGKPLSYGDYVLTLLSLYWPVGRTAIEKFARSCQEKGGARVNPIFVPEAPRLLRVVLGASIRKVRMAQMYDDLREDLSRPETERVMETALRQGLADATRDANFRDFILALKTAGFVDRDLLKSKVAVETAYTIFLLGRRAGVKTEVLQRLVGRWIYMAVLTRRYSSSSDTAAQADLDAVPEVLGPAGFVKALEARITAALDSVFWERLPEGFLNYDLDSPAMIAYFAALCARDARALFSNIRVADFLKSWIRTAKRNVDRHHLFPNAYLKAQGVGSEGRTLGANFTLVGKERNIRIGGAAPADYLPSAKADVSAGDWAKMEVDHALPQGWENLPYEEFLRQRASLMAALVRDVLERTLAPLAG